MLEPQDIQKLLEVLPTKNDFNALRADVNGVRTDVSDLRMDFNELRNEVSEIRMTLNNLVTITDGLVGRMESLNQEYMVLKERDTRYERWFHEIAAKVGVTLVP